MSQALSPSFVCCYGLARVARVWKISRASVYRSLKETPPNTSARRPGPVGACSDAELADHIRRQIDVSRLHGDGYYAGEEIRACEEAGITVTLPKPMTSNSKAAGRFGKQDFRYVAAEDAYVCPAGQRLAYSFTTEDKGLLLRRYRTNACQSCAIRHSCTTGKERLISRWEHEAVLETVQARLDQHPEKMTMRRQTAEHPFGTIKCWMGATHFLTKRLPKVATEMALNVLAYNIKRVMAIIGVAGLLEALAA